MAEAKTKDLPDTYGVLTDEGIAKLRERIRIQVNKPTPPPNYEVTWDGSRHFAFGYGDDNHLWCDRHYGATTSWGGLIALPTDRTSTRLSSSQPCTSRMPP